MQHPERVRDHANNLHIAHIACNIAESQTLRWAERKAKPQPVAPPPPADGFAQLTSFQRDLVVLQHGEQDPASRWRFVEGGAVPIQAPGV